jgi:CheY-like chemotaxis protein
MHDSITPIKGLRVLIVDDYRDSADSLGMLFRKAGCQTRICYNGNDALHAAEEFLPQVVVLDLLMPDMDGYEVARQISERFPNSRPIVVAMSGYGQQGEQHKAALAAAGFDFYFLKPADIREVFDTISWAVRERAGEELFADCQAA